MALTIKQLNDFARNTKFTQKTIQDLYKYLRDSNQDKVIDIDFLGKAVKIMVDNGLNNYQELVEMLKQNKVTEPIDGGSSIESLGKPKKPQMSKEEIQDQLHKDMNNKVHNNERIKLGYSKRRWAEIQRFEKMMVDYLQVAVPKFAEEMVVQQLTADDDKAVELFLNMEKKWKDFCRKHIINRYPGSDKNGKVRDNILNLFANKVSSFLGRKK
jgi:hypothetical protein